MKLRLFGVGAAVDAMLLCVAPSAMAQDPVQEPLKYTVTVTGHTGVVRGASSSHFLSFSGPVQIPGVGLEPGTYVFQPLGTSLVRVLSADRSTVYATFFTTPVGRLSTNGSEMSFHRVNDDAPVRIASWFLPGQLDGRAPFYPGSPSTD